MPLAICTRKHGSAGFIAELFPHPVPSQRLPLQAVVPEPSEKSPARVHRNRYIASQNDTCSLVGRTELHTTFSIIKLPKKILEYFISAN